MGTAYDDVQVAAVELCAAIEADFAPLIEHKVATLSFEYRDLSLWLKLRGSATNLTQLEQSRNEAAAAALADVRSSLSSRLEAIDEIRLKRSLHVLTKADEVSAGAAVFYRCSLCLTVVADRCELLNCCTRLR